ncbi:hypothetical protein OF846_002893 [Rhodotorula toruloides]|nr:hypothetical protein OF846_002893 [Rhodotorula toruloides]
MLSDGEEVNGVSLCARRDEPGWTYACLQIAWLSETACLAESVEAERVVEDNNRDEEGWASGQGSPRWADLNSLRVRSDTALNTTGPADDTREALLPPARRLSPPHLRMPTTLGALTPWLHREFLSQRNAYGDSLPTTSVEEGKRVQLIRATGMTEEDGETLVWAEMSDGELWIDCCIPLSLVEQYNSKSARTFAASSQSKCIFRLLSWCFVIASPLIPSHGQHSPRKSSTLATSSTATPRTQAPRVCLRIDSFKLFGMGEGTMQADCKPFRNFTPDVGRVRGEGKEDIAKREREKREQERVAWVRRLEERARGSGEGQPKDDALAVPAEQVTFVDDLPRPSTAASEPRRTTQQSPVAAVHPHAAPPAAPAARPGWPADKDALLPRIDFGEVEALLNRYKRKQGAQHEAPVAKDKGKGKAKAVEPEPAHAHPAARAMPADPTIGDDGGWTSASALLTRKRPRASSASMSAAPRPLAPSAAATANPPRPSPPQPAPPLSASPSRRRRDASQPAAVRSPAAGRPSQPSDSPRSKKDDVTARQEKELVEMAIDTVEEKAVMDEDLEEDVTGAQAIPKVDKGKKRASPSPSPAPSPSPSPSPHSVRHDDVVELAAPSPKRRRSSHSDSNPPPRFVPVIPLDILDYTLWCSMRGLVAVRGSAGADLLDEGCAWLYPSRLSCAARYAFCVSTEIFMTPHAGPRSSRRLRALVQYRSLDKRPGRSPPSDSESETSDSGDDIDDPPPSPPATNACYPLLLPGAFVLFLYKRDNSAASSVPTSPTTLTQTTTTPASTVLVAATRSPFTPCALSPSPSALSPSLSATTPSTPPTTSTPSATAATSASTSSSVDQSKLKALGISTFLGNLTGAIASWYHTDSTTDSTNDDDSIPGFAPSLKTMLSSFNGDATAAKKGFCGLKATVYSPKTGRLIPMIIADAFDDKWVRTPNSIDVIYGSFAELFGSATDNKDDVVKDVWWMLTGERDDKFTYKGVGVG